MVTTLDRQSRGCGFDSPQRWLTFHCEFLIFPGTGCFSFFIYYYGILYSYLYNNIIKLSALWRYCVHYVFSWMRTSHEFEIISLLLSFYTNCWNYYIKRVSFTHTRMLNLLKLNVKIYLLRYFQHRPGGLRRSHSPPWRPGGTASCNCHLLRFGLPLEWRYSKNEIGPVNRYVYNVLFHKRHANCHTMVDIACYHLTTDSEFWSN